MANDQLLEEVLQQLRANNGLQQQLLEQIASDARRSRRPSGGNSGPSSRATASADNALSGLASSASQLSSGMMNANSASDAMGAMFQGIGSASKVLPVFGGAIGAAAGAAQQFYEFLNSQLQTFNSLNEAGLAASDGMFGLQKALATGRLSYEEFMSATAQYRDVIASMGADGVQNFGNLMNSVITSEQAFGRLNISNQALASSLGSLMKQQKMYQQWDRMSNTEQSLAAQEYVKNIQDYSKSLGMGIDELAGKMAKSGSEVTGIGTKMALMNSGLDEVDASKTAENVNLLLNSFGPMGEQLNQQFAKALVSGGAFDTDSAIGQMVLTNNEFADFFYKLQEMARDGTLATDQGREYMRTWLSDQDNANAILSTVEQARLSYGEESANQMYQMVEAMQNYNKNTTKVTGEWDNMINDFNLKLGAFFTGFKINTAELFLRPDDFIRNIFGEKWGNWLLTGAFDWEVEDIPMLPSVKEWLSHWMEPVSWLYDQMMGYADSTADKMQAIEKPSWESILRALVPSWLADIIFEGGDYANGGLAGASEMEQKVQEALTKDVVPALKDSALWVMDDLANKMKVLDEASDHVSTAVSDWWNKPSSTVVNNNTTNTSTSNVTTPVTPVAEPELETSADRVKKEQERKDFSDSVVERLDKLSRTLADMLDINNNIERASRETASNTTGSGIN